MLWLHLLAWFLILGWFYYNFGATVDRKSVKKSSNWWYIFDITHYVNTSIWICAAAAFISIVAYLLYNIWGIDPGLVIEADSSRVDGPFGNAGIAVQVDSGRAGRRAGIDARRTALEV